MSAVNEVANMMTCDKVPGTQGCPVDASPNGTIENPQKIGPLCDAVIASDAISKLRIAANLWKTTGRPFFLASGFRKPHMPWRFPKSFATFYPPPESIGIAKHPIMDVSVPPIAHHTPDLGSQNGGSPYVPMASNLAQYDRLYYYSSVSWTDSRVGAVLDELDHLDLRKNTLVVMHSDHGWALGEHGQWQKFNNWEVGTRVPLMIRAPWLGPRAAGQRLSLLAELVDVFPTMVDLAGIALPEGDALPLDGVSLGPAMRGKSNAIAPKAAVLSVFARCPLSQTGGGSSSGDEHWITNKTEMWKNNWCEFVDRSAIPWMGFSMRTTQWRYTEWAQWNGTTLSPHWAVNAGVELYDHRPTDRESVINNFDATENVNVAEKNPTIVSTLSLQLHHLVATKYRRGV
jgi:arylsulfatase A-like enzyme